MKEKRRYSCSKLIELIELFCCFMVENEYHENEDEKIVKLVQEGDIDSFSVLVERYEVKIKRYAKKFLSGREDIEDVVQNVFIKAYKNIQGFDVKRKFSSWIYRIAHNEFVNALKKKKTGLQLFSLDILLPYLVDEEKINQEIEFKEIRQSLRYCLNKIDIKYKEPIILYYLENMSYREVADIMRIPISTVGIRLKRGKKMLKLCYEKTKHEK